MGKQIVKKIRVKNELGLHTRPATMIVKILQECKSSVTFTYKKESVDARSILSILMLAVQKNGILTVNIEGDDAEETLKRLEAAFDSHFGEKHE